MVNFVSQIDNWVKIQHVLVSVSDKAGLETLVPGLIDINPESHFYVEQACANIDIGGPCMLRAAAKNYLRVTPVVNPADYPALLDTLKANDGALDLPTRFEYARKAFSHTAHYDAAISAFLMKQEPADIANIYQFSGVISHESQVIIH